MLRLQKPRLSASERPPKNCVIQSHRPNRTSSCSVVAASTPYLYVLVYLRMPEENLLGAGRQPQSSHFLSAELAAARNECVFCGPVSPADFPHQRRSSSRLCARRFPAATHPHVRCILRTRTAKRASSPTGQVHARRAITSRIQEGRHEPRLSHCHPKQYASRREPYPHGLYRS